MAWFLAFALLEAIVLFPLGSDAEFSSAFTVRQFTGEVGSLQIQNEVEPQYIIRIVEDVGYLKTSF